MIHWDLGLWALAWVNLVQVAPNGCSPLYLCYPCHFGFFATWVRSKICQENIVLIFQTQIHFVTHQIFHMWVRLQSSSVRLLESGCIPLSGSHSVPDHCILVPLRLLRWSSWPPFHCSSCARQVCRVQLFQICLNSLPLYLNKWGGEELAFFQLTISDSLEAWRFGCFCCVCKRS